MGQAGITEMFIDLWLLLKHRHQKQSWLLLLIQFSLYRNPTHLPSGIRHLPHKLISLSMIIPFTLLGSCSSPSIVAHPSSLCLQPSSSRCLVGGYVQSLHLSGISPNTFCSQVHFFSCKSLISLTISCFQIPFFFTRCLPVMNTFLQ